MNKINLGLIGYGNVGSGVVDFLQKKARYIREKFQTEFFFRAVCDRSFDRKTITLSGETKLTQNIEEVIKDPEIDCIIELIGGLHPAKDIALDALKAGKHFVTANKELIANFGQDLFAQAHKSNCHVYYESSVMAGVPIIKTVTEGVAGNQFTSLFGIINGTCNFILSEMARLNLSFEEALKGAQERGFAESDPTLDINGMDSTHKLSVLAAQAMGKFVKPKDIYTEGITHISQADLEYAAQLGFTIKLLAIAKKVKKELELRVHPTLFTAEHPLASINGVYNAIYLHTDPLGDLLLSGEGAGKMAAASGVVSDLINLAAHLNSGTQANRLLGNLYHEDQNALIKPIDQVQTKYYFRFITVDKPGVMSQITKIIGDHGISINSVSQKVHDPTKTVPVIMLTEKAPEFEVRSALEQIKKLPVVKGTPVAIRVENLT